MSENYARFLALSDQDRKDVFEAAADRLDTLPSYVEKDFWVCFVLDALYNRLPGGHPRLLFKGGTALSKAFGLIRRFSEDIDLVVYREGLGFEGDRDPTNPGGISGKRRKVLFDELKEACGTYIRDDLTVALGPLLGERCQIVTDDEDGDQQTLLIEYPTLYPSAELPYVLPRVKLEAGARSALDPNAIASVKPYIADDLADDWAFDVGNVHVIAPERTYLEKLLILHGAFCGHRDAGRLPADKDRISRHYYDVAMITGTEIGRAALADEALLTSVREHNLIAFKQAWKKFDEAVPGSLCVVPPAELRAAIEEDYGAMQGMMLGDAPPFDWVMDQLQIAEDTINRR
ncbi:nucleotidyl transferase AbiEii/AbiGii toxin family protein [Alkalilacustris brevis]|uniref:nucleotidyl transferase AbiEii/AbiGii toxin family protein n=1 Tax=Alkalilacustris brevis TaxID=2026338 RepID=UPI000E0DAD27|nr:nucleotidyl transferase AbiEii/AbiGii toxin family protein [Alkalilacustris brevis]